MSVQPEQQNIVQLAEHTPDLSTLVSAVVAADLADTLSSAGKFTVFAPTNEAFKALPAGTLASLMKPANKAKLADILKYHVLPEQVLSTQLKASQTVATVEGKTVLVEKCNYRGVRVGPSASALKTVVKADNLASNGVVHIIDGVLLPPTPAPQPQGQNIVQLAEHTADLSILVSALVAGDLADTLSSAGKFTVFAPTNEAFKALPAGTLDTLMKPENKAKLIDILKYHVLPEEVLSSQLKPFQAVKTVEGKLLHVQEWGGKVRVGPSLLSKDLKNVIKADNVASNGVVHIINGVLLPPASSVLEVLEATTHKAKNIVQLAKHTEDLSTLVTALKKGQLAHALSGAGPFTVFAPTNAAFAKLPKATLSSLLEPRNIKELDAILEYHVIS